jgi:hypothetical protein
MDAMNPSPPSRVVRVLLESVLTDTGCAGPTGLQLVVPLELFQNPTVETFATAFGYTTTVLDRVAARGDSLVVVMADAHPDMGIATDAALAGLLRDLRPEEGSFSTIEVAEALDTPAGRAGGRIRLVQRALQRVFGLRDPLFGQPRFASSRWPDRRLVAPFYLDEKVDMAAIQTTRNPLLPGSALTLDAYPVMPVVQRLPWTPESP